ncbi:MAG: hypothetical protein R3F17_12840 [Planctomycetota bacterium]
MTQTTTPTLLHGPVDSKRLGRTLSIDITTPHNSLVVERGSELPRASLIVTTCARNLIEMSRNGDKLDHILIVGTGVDPAEHPDLRNIVENVRALRDKWFSRAKLGLVSQVTDLEDYNLRATLAMFNRVFLPMHWGNTKLFATWTGRKPTELATYIKYVSGMENVTLEAQFTPGTTGNMAGTSLTHWFKKVQEAAPAEIHLLGGSPPTAKKTKMKAATKPQRAKILEELIEKTGLVASDYDEEVLYTAS